MNREVFLCEFHGFLSDDVLHFAEFGTVQIKTFSTGSVSNFKVPSLRTLSLTIYCV